jgi:hypothetical protein
MLLMQWAAWSRNELAKLGHSKSSWQMELQATFDQQEAAHSEFEPGADLAMLDVDTALAMVKVDNPVLFHALRNRYRYGEHYPADVLERARRAFIAAYISPLDEDEFLYDSLRRGRSAP